MKFFDDLLGRGAQPDETAGDTMQPDETRELLEKHEETLKAVDRVLSQSQERVARAIDDTGAAIEQRRPMRRRRSFR